MPSITGFRSRVLGYALTRYYRFQGVELSNTTRFYGRPRISRMAGSRIVFEDGVTLTSTWQANDLDANWPCTIRTLNRGATIKIGASSGLSSATISAAIQIDIGMRVLIGSGVVITDSDHHVVSPDDVAERRFLGPPEPRPSDGVSIGDDVFIGARTIVLKGARVGNGTVIGAGSVVSGVLEPMSIYAGNPAKLIRGLR